MARLAARLSRVVARVVALLLLSSIDEFGLGRDRKRGSPFDVCSDLRMRLWFDARWRVTSDMLACRSTGRSVGGWSGE